MTALIVHGASSGAGKSLLSAGICAALHRRGVRVAPFKAQNMSNNARVVDGGEIGSAQWFQARAAGIEPSVDHNPVLLKPEADTRSQVVIQGQVSRELTDMAWRDRSPLLWAAVAVSYARVRADAEVVIIEGAGSPAEINLIDVDLANHRIAHHADARSVVVADIDRGGAFAHLYGTWALVGDELRPRIRGFVLNKFRGDPALLAPGPALLEERTGVPVVGVVPMADHGLPDEDGADPRPTANGPCRVRVVRGPAASNLDEWWPLRATTSFAWATEPADLADADLIVVPGSKLVAADLDWARRSGIDRALADAQRRQVPMLAVCGGIQLLGNAVDDPHGVEAPARGLGLVPVSTTLAATKRVRASSARFAPDLPDPWRALSGLAVSGYEVRYGVTTVGPTDGTGGAPGVTPVLDDDLGFVAGNVLGTYLHGLAENSDVVQALTGQPHPRPLAQVLDDLGQLVESTIDLDRLLG